MKIPSHNWVIKYLQDRGLEVILNFTSDHVKHWVIKWQGELVGWSYDNIMYLYPVMPSLLLMDILPMRRAIEIPFGLPSLEMHKRLRETVNELKNSSESYDELIKRYRAKKVRDYFNRKKDEAERLDRVLEYRKFLDRSSV